MLTTSARVPELFGRDGRHYEELPPQQFRFTGTTLAFDFAQFIYDVVQAVSIIALSSKTSAHMIRGFDRGINSVRSESGKPWCLLSKPIYRRQ